MKKETRITIITFIIIVLFWYIIPGFIYFFNTKNIFLYMTTIFVFIQYILSDNFLDNYKVLNHFNLAGQKERNRSKIQYYRIWTTNLTISFYIIELFIPINRFKTFLKSLVSFLLWPGWSANFLTFMIIWILVYIISNLLELIEKSIANLMKKQNNF